MDSKQHTLNHYQAISEAIAALFPSQVEVVVHDLETLKIAHISNAFSNRDIGDESLIDPAELEKEAAGKNLIGPYTKSTPNGERLKSVTAVLRDQNDKATQLLCINMKLGALEQSIDLLRLLAGFENSNSSEALLADDWRERANLVIGKTLSGRNTSMQHATKEDKLAVIASLEAAEIFQIRGSAEYLAKALGISRASLYNLLKQARSNIATED